MGMKLYINQYISKIYSFFLLFSFKEETQIITLIIKGPIQGKENNKFEGISCEYNCSH